MSKINFIGNSSFNTERDNNRIDENIEKSNTNSIKILCKHCGRTAENGIRCLGICVADNDY